MELSFENGVWENFFVDLDADLVDLAHDRVHPSTAPNSQTSQRVETRARPVCRGLDSLLSCPALALRIADWTVASPKSAWRPHAPRAPRGADGSRHATNAPDPIRIRRRAGAATRRHARPGLRRSGARNRSSHTRPHDLILETRNGRTKHTLRNVDLIRLIIYITHQLFSPMTIVSSQALLNLPSGSTRRATRRKRVKRSP